MEEDILLKLENVEICREENRVLHDACLTLRNGEFVYVIGKVGSGKSSLLKSLYCEIPILRGEARIMDYNLTRSWIALVATTLKALKCISAPFLMKETIQ